MNRLSLSAPEFREAFELWDADYLYFIVREPFPTRTTGTSVVFGRMPENGVIFTDGIEKDFWTSTPARMLLSASHSGKGCW